MPVFELSQFETGKANLVGHRGHRPQTATARRSQLYGGVSGANCQGRGDVWVVAWSSRVCLGPLALPAGLPSPYVILVASGRRHL